MRLGANASMSVMLHDLQLRFGQWLSKHGLTCSCPRFTPTALHRDKQASYPIFKCKAAQSPTLVGWLADVSHEYAAKVPENKQASLVWLMLCNLRAFF